eukprot:scaffold4803_cov144-Amphora_coffeaeformis.AAC.2
MTKLVLLTLNKHKEGIWITNLVQALRDVGQEGIQTIAIEEFFGAAPSVGALFQGTRALINRVSDAADPIAFKITLSVLTAASKCGIPVFNGPEAYALCANKYCHHLVFEMAGVQTPPSHIINCSNPVDYQECIQKAGGSNSTLQYPLLIKPNSGGFGAGILRLDSETDSVTEDQLQTPDGIRLIQNFIAPSDNHIYRVWFLNNQVQCSVKRRVNDTSDDITSGCAGGVCQRPTKNTESSSFPFTACAIPAVIQQDVKRILAQIPDAHAGSIEYLFDAKQRPVYFDLNLLSTLPIIDKVERADEIWAQGYDPWSELARGVLQVCHIERRISGAIWGTAKKRRPQIGMRTASQISRTSHAPMTSTHTARSSRGKDHHP